MTSDEQSRTESLNKLWTSAKTAARDAPLAEASADDPEAGRDELMGYCAIVTGAGAGIGRAIARRLVLEGVAVVVADIDESAGRDLVREFEASGGRAAFVASDVGIEADVRKMIEYTVKRFGGLDILVNNAGIAPPPSFPQADPVHWGRTLDVNLRGAMLAIQLGIEEMGKGGGGAVVNISSIAGMVYQPYGAPEYAASKAALVHLTAALGSLQETHQVRVNCICPGWVETEAVAAYLAAADPAELASLRPAPPAKLIQPEEIAELVLMFVRDGTLAGRIAVWPDGEPWHLVPDDLMFRY